MAITETCGHHCGIRSNAEGTFTREGHCDCPECHDGHMLPEHLNPVSILTRMPMCDRWHVRSGGIRPWEGLA